MCKRLLSSMFVLLLLTGGVVACGDDGGGGTSQGVVLEFGQSVPAGGGVVQSYVVVQTDDGEEIEVWLPNDDAVWAAMSDAADSGNTIIEYEQDGDSWTYVGEVGAATTTTAPATTALPAPTTCPPADGVDQPVRVFSEAPPICIDPTTSYTAVFDTTEGEIRVALDTETTPDTVNNFVVLARYGYYDDTPVFRTDPSIGIIQAGGTDAQASPGYTIPDEGDGYTYEPGQLVMARTGEPDSAGAQFFLVADAAASALDAQGTYVVFGNADAAGLEVVQAILALHEDQPDNPLGGAPNPPVTINSVTIEET